MDSHRISIDYSSRRPKNQAWRARLGDHITYADTREDAVRLHADKLRQLERIDSILKLCADSTNK